MENTPTENPAFIEKFQSFFQILVDGLDAVLFYPIPLPFDLGTFPFLVLWLVSAGLFFTVFLRGVNIALLGHAVKVTFASMTDDTPQKKGRISSFQAMTAAVSGTVGLGNIAGVAIAISLGGPGALVWMIVAAFLGTATKLAEVTLGHLYRTIDEDGTVHGCLLYTSPSPRDQRGSRMPSSA